MEFIKICARWTSYEDETLTPFEVTEMNLMIMHLQSPRTFINEYSFEIDNFNLTPLVVDGYFMLAVARKCDDYGWQLFKYTNIGPLLRS